jgi:hypothetical protein
MSDYSVTTDFSVKDGLTTGDSEKIILGADFDVEFDAIAVAVATKYDSADLASQAQAEAETLNTVLMTPLRVANWADANAGAVGDLQAIAAPGADRLWGYDQTSTTTIGFTMGTGLAFNGTTIEISHLGFEDLTDPAADRILFWDDASPNALAWLSLGNGLSISTTTLAWSASGISGHDTFTDFVADEHVAHSGVTLTAGTGLSGGGTIAASRTFDLDVDSLTNNIGATGAVDLDVDEVAIANSTATEKCFAASLLTPEVPATVTGTTDTLAETDFGKLTKYSNATITVTLPNGLKTGFWALLEYTGTGTLTLSATTTLNTPGGLTTVTTQYGKVLVIHEGSNVWSATGDLA